MSFTLRYPEAFRLLRYRCAACGFVEVLWNSRDGVTPFTVACARAVAEDTPVGVGRPMPYHFAMGAHSGPPTTVWIMLAKMPGFAEDWKLVPCGGIATQVLAGVARDFLALSGDYWAPNHDPQPGERYFRDGTAAEARGIMRARIDAGVYRNLGGTRHVMSDEETRAVLRSVSVGDPSFREFEFAPGWPLLIVRGSDADMLPVRGPVRGSGA